MVMSLLKSLYKSLYKNAKDMLVVKRWPGDIWTSGARGELIKRDYGQKYVCPERQLTLTKTIDDIDIPTRLEIFDIHGGKIQTRDFVCFSLLPLLITH